MRDDFFHQKRGLDLLNIRQRRELRVVGFLIGGQIRSGDQKDVVLLAEDPMRFDDAGNFFQGFFKFCDFFTGSLRQGDEYQCLETHADKLGIDNGLIAFNDAGFLKILNSSLAGRYAEIGLF